MPRRERERVYMCDRDTCLHVPTSLTCLHVINVHITTFLYTAFLQHHVDTACTVILCMYNVAVPRQDSMSPVRANAVLSGHCNIKLFVGYP